jgi:8-oxo-dGTP pyrophosphatase MutT (NUDIX family)
MVEHVARGEKVVVYITQDDRLLVFRHTEHPEAGIQVPAGTVEVGEDLKGAAIREACEETGLAEAELELRDKLGEDIHHFENADGLSSVRRHFYQIEFAGTSPQRWLHYEMNPSDGTPGPIEFELYWVQFPDEVPVLAGNQGAMLSKLKITR